MIGKGRNTLSTHQPTSSLAELLDNHREWYDEDCAIYVGCSCGWDNDTKRNNDGYTEHLASVVQTHLGHDKLSLIRDYAVGLSFSSAYKPISEDIFSLLDD